MAQNICHELIDSTTGPIPQKQTRWLTTCSPSAVPKHEDDPTMGWKGRKRRDTNEGTQQRTNDDRTGGTTRQGEINEGTTTRR
ncbi:hypothetical protein BDN67DRAFT_975552 [Paxillus ammoniavirescens]|nr:hypothetical protein BDN67DRAFT_975552 [Paxillus ammoniavirescens]